MKKYFLASIFLIIIVVLFISFTGNVLKGKSKPESTDQEETIQKVEETTQKVEETTQKVEETTQKVEETTQKVEETTQKVEETTQKVEETTQRAEETTQKGDETDSNENDKEDADSTTSKQSGGSIQVVANPKSIPVLVNKQNKLPESYNPSDLVYTEIPFIFQEKTEKRKMRAEAAAAINQLFTDAKKQGISLLGVSGYRSHTTQAALFNYYVSKDGYNKAITYSALPGTSEHETGLAIDVTGGDGKCPAEDCFGGTKEANWLEENAAEYGFIIRYPKGKEDITGYKYEPWHLRYVGKSISLEIMNNGITLEEYFNAKQVNN